MSKNTQSGKDKRPQSQTKPSGTARAEQASDEYLGELFGLGDDSEESPDGRIDVATSRPEPDENGDFDPYVVWMDVELCDDNPYQPRNVIFKQPLEKLVASLNENGQIQAATGRPHPTRAGRIQLGVGHRRKNAIKQGANAGIKLREPHQYIGKIRVEVSAKDDEQMLTEAYAENEDREPLSVFDRATYYTMLRELESRRLRGGLTPVSSETARKRAGAAVTADGLMSWEELVEIRKREGKPLPGARTLRRCVGVLDIPEELRDRLAAINLADPEDEKLAFKGITEKHCAAVLLLQGDEPKQKELVEEIERNRLSANEAESRARQKRDGNLGITTSRSQSPVSGDAPSDDAPPTPSPDAGAVPAGGSGSSSSSKRKVKPGKKQGKDLVEAFLLPAAHSVREAVRLWPQLKVGDEYNERMLEQLDQLDAQSAQLRAIIKDRSKK